METVDNSEENELSESEKELLDLIIAWIIKEIIP